MTYVGCKEYNMGSVEAVYKLHFTKLYNVSWAVYLGSVYISGLVWNIFYFP